MNDLRDRRQTLMLLFGAVLGVFALRLFFLQVISHDYAASADKNVIKRVVIEPSRGVIYDRHQRIYVTNTPIFNLEIVPAELHIPDTALFERYLKMDRATIRRKIAEATAYNRVKPSPFATQIDAGVYAALQEHLWACRGIHTRVRNTRDYRYPVGANFLGYISEVSKKDIAKDSAYYTQGDLIGTSGLERQYEPQLRGRKGVKMVLVDVHGREVGEFGGGALDTLPAQGEDLVLSIDAELQRFGEELMAGKVGSIVALEPASGEVLAFVSGPTYNPNLLTGMETSQHFRALARDSLKPLFNRPLMAMYPPGSIFKITNALAALEEGTLGPGTLYGCGGGFARNGGRPRCHAHPSPLALPGAIQHSCNAYFAAAYVDMLYSSRMGSFMNGYRTWYDYMAKFGIGHRLGIDVPNEKPGLLPTEKRYDKWYGANRWKGMTIVSNSIGQGEVLLTPLQMANTCAMLANRGHYVQPHFLKQLASGRKLAHWDTVRVPIERRHFELAVAAMEQVVVAGTGWTARIPGIPVCGKTGTAENPHGEDHSVFFAFAPRDNPKIAIAVIVENAGYGATWAAPMAALMIERHLRGYVTDKWRLQRVLEGELIKRPRGAPGPSPAQRAAREAYVQAVLAREFKPLPAEVAPGAAVAAAPRAGAPPSPRPAVVLPLPAAAGMPAGAGRR